MLQITYISSAMPGLADDQVDDILKASRLNNRRHALTGLLLYDGRRFLQHIEGEAEALDATYGHILADPRHRAVVELSRREVEDRHFPDWAMAFERAGSAAGEEATLYDQVAALVAGTDSSISEHFLGFARLRSSAG